MEKLRILFLCPQPLWPLNTGARLRNFHLANAVASGCDVTVLQLVTPGAVPAMPSHRFHQILSAERGKSYTPLNLIRGLTGPLPITVLNYTSAQAASVLGKVLTASNFHAVQMESIHLFRYLETIRSCTTPPRVVLDWHNIESELMQRYSETSGNPLKKLIAARTAHLLEQLETTALQTFAAHTVVSDREKEKLLARDPKALIHVIPNGVDTASFSRPELSATNPSGRQTLLFVGSMDYHANSEAVLWFCREIWPSLSAEFPNLDFKVVGRNPPLAVQALTSSRIAITGTVDDVRPFYHQAFAVLVPLRVGGGTRLKILEAMAAGVPVISTRLGAEGLTVENGRHILLADTAEDMATSIRALLNQSGLATGLSQAARALVEQQYDWAVLGQKLGGILNSLC